MSLDLVILFFVLGVVASWMGSDLQIPESVSKFLSIFLLLSLGLKGGHEVRVATDLGGFGPALGLGLALCFVIPTVLFFVLRPKIGRANAAALGASYGSVSAVTFITAESYLQTQEIKSSGFMVAVMALMEIPAILFSVYLYMRSKKSLILVSQSSLIRSILTTKSAVLLVGGLLIGFSMNEFSWKGISFFVVNCFKGVLAFFLLDLGLMAQKQMRQILKFKLASFFVALVSPLVFGSITLVIGHFFGLERGDQVLLSVLVGSASYIAAPAAVRTAIPSANPSLYLALPLALTFPMNVFFGIPLYLQMSTMLG